MTANGTYTSEEQIHVLARRIMDLERRLIEADRKILTAEQTRVAVAQGYADECGQLQRLREDAVAILNVLVEAGVATRDRLNAAVEAVTT